MITNAQFFKKLARSKEEWYVNISGSIRLKKDDCVFCPITYIEKSLNKQYFDMGDYPTAAKDLGISRLRADAIIKAADDDCITRSQKRLRKQFLKALKLKENENV